MRRSLFLLALETSAKAIRTGFGVVGALTDCGMPGPQVRWADALADKEAEEDVAEPDAELEQLRLRDVRDRDRMLRQLRLSEEAPLSADFDDEPVRCRVADAIAAGMFDCTCPDCLAVEASIPALEDDPLAKLLALLPESPTHCPDCQRQMP